MGRRLRRRPVARNGQMRGRAGSRTGPAAERNGRSSPPTSSSPMLGLSTQRRVHHRSAKRGKSARPFRVRRSRGLPREFLVTGTDTTSSVASSDTTAPFRSPPSQGSVLTPRAPTLHRHVSHDPCRAASAAFASPVRTAKNSADCPMNSPSAVSALAVAIAAPFVWVGRMIETIGNLRSRKIVGSGMIRLVCNSSPSALRSGKTRSFVGLVRGGACRLCLARSGSASSRSRRC